MVFISTEHIGDRAARKEIDECVQELNQREKQLRQREEKVQAKEQSLSTFVAFLLDKKETAEAEIRAGWEKLKADQAELKKAENELKLRRAAVTQRELDIDEREEAVQRRERVGQPKQRPTAPPPPMPGFRLSAAGSSRRSNTTSLASSSYSWLLDEQQASPDEVELGRLERPVRVKTPRRRTGHNLFLSNEVPKMGEEARKLNLGRGGALMLAHREWKALSDEKKAAWSERAKAQPPLDGGNKRRRTDF